MLYFANMGGVGFWTGFGALLFGAEFLNMYVMCLILRFFTQITIHHIVQYPFLVAGGMGSPVRVGRRLASERGIVRYEAPRFHARQADVTGT